VNLAAAWFWFWFSATDNIFTKYDEQDYKCTDIQSERSATEYNHQQDDNPKHVAA